MQVFAMCMECQKELGHPSFEPFFVSYYDDRISHVECSRGHKSALVLQSQKFEVLMESGASALAAGFTLEACASFSAALERLYEFAIRVFMVNKGINDDAYAAMFKEMARQSERQLGAFMALYLTEIGSPYKPNKNITEFRNAVIHKGQIPTPEEALTFCANVYGSVLATTDQLRQRFPHALSKAVMLDLLERNQKLPPDLPRATGAGGMLFSLANAQNSPSFAEALAQMEEHKDSLQKSAPYLKALSFLLRVLHPATSGQSGSAQQKP